MCDKKHFSPNFSEMKTSLINLNATRNPFIFIKPLNNSIFSPLPQTVRDFWL